MQSSGVSGSRNYEERTFHSGIVCIILCCRNACRVVNRAVSRVLSVESKGKHVIQAGYRPFHDDVAVFCGGAKGSHKNSIKIRRNKRPTLRSRDFPHSSTSNCLYCLI